MFAQTAGFGFVNFDDDDYVTANPEVAGGLNIQSVVWVLTHTACGFYHPLTLLSFMANYQLHGLWAGGYHLTNVLLHTASAILLFLVLRRMTGAVWRSAFVAAVFAIHPLRVESVAWVAERKDVLATFFFMLTLWAYVRYVEGRMQPAPSGDTPHLTRHTPPFSTRSPLYYALTLVLFALALLSKPTVVTLPFVLLLLDYWPLRRLEGRQKEEGRGKNEEACTAQKAGFRLRPGSFLLLEKLPLLALAAGAGAMTVVAARPAIAAHAHLSLPLRLGNALVSYAVYLRQMIWPAGLAACYPLSRTGPPASAIVLSFLLLALISAGAWVLRRRRPWLLIGWLWYVGMLVPMIGILQEGVYAHADRMTYLPQIGLYVLVAWAAVDWGGAWRWGGVALPCAAVMIVMGLLVLARIQTRYWRDSVSLWTHALACTSGNFLAHNNLGAALAAQGKRAEAAAHFERALQLKPDYVQAHNNLGEALAQQGKWNAAFSHYERVLQLRPDSAEAHYNVGVALTQRGELNAAIPHFERALQLAPDYAEAHSGLAITLGQEGQWDAAIPHFERALQLKPDSAEAQSNLGLALRQQGKWNEAIAHYERAVQLKPDSGEAHYNLAAALTQQGRLNEAIPHYERVLQLNPDHAQAHNKLGLAWAGEGQWNAAITHFERALQLKPDYAEAACNLAWLLATCRESQLRNPAEALRRAQQARELTQSRSPEVLDTLAAAQAAGGDFVRAVETARQAMALAAAAGNRALAGEVESRLRLYQANQPYCQPPPERGQSKVNEAITHFRKTVPAD